MNYPLGYLLYFNYGFEELMFFNYRVVKHKDDGLGHEYYTINRVVYDEKNNVKNINIDPAYLTASSKEELMDKLNKISKALENPEVDFVL